MHLHARALAMLGLSSLVGVLAAGAAPLLPELRALLGWDCAALTAIVLHLFVIVRTSAEQVRRRAATEDLGRNTVWVLALVAGLFSMLGSFVLMTNVPEDYPHPALIVGLCMASVSLTWLLTQCVFTLRYAHLYYRDAGDIGGLDFPGDEPPDDLDFAYFSFTLGMTFQVSDVSITDRSLRRTALMHCVLAYFYNTTILALVVNLTVGHLSK